VWLVKTSPVHVAHWGIYVTTPSITDEKGIARIVVAIDNQGRENASVSVQTEVLELAPDGSAGVRVAMTSRRDLEVGAGASSAVDSTADVTNPRRWDLATPNRYLVRTMIRQGEQEGALVPRSHNLVQLEIEGPGEIVAVGNGDATSHEPFQAKERSAYNGLCQVIVKGRSGQPGPITLKAKSNGLKDAEISFSSK
jgi:Glycoside hydrolase family 2 C-terminal domain 5